MRMVLPLQVSAMDIEPRLLVGQLPPVPRKSSLIIVMTAGMLNQILGERHSFFNNSYAMDIRDDRMVRVKVSEEVLELRPTKIVCLLRSYAAHARELGNEIPQRPFFFLKPPSSLLENHGSIVIPKGVEELHHEVELAFVISRGGSGIRVEEAFDHIGLFLPMLDITARDVQERAKNKGLPWTEAKGHDTFAPVGPQAVRASEYDWRDRRIWLEVNGEIRQDSSTGLLIFPPELIVSYISEIMTLEPGDIIMTGTPAGVGPLRAGDLVRAGIDGMEPMEFDVVRA
jgi:2-keto-4-pentenoate hydratase/2-oxohepta-3-ene-1,7-dioic acid hydratase in catechol pathway